MLKQNEINKGKIIVYIACGFILKGLFNLSPKIIM